MRKLTKHFPSQLAHTVFINHEDDLVKMNKLDIDIYFALIYLCDKHLSNNTSSDYADITYVEIKDFIGSGVTKTIKASLIKLNNVEIISNCLKSYQDKSPTRTKPFSIEVVTSSNGKSYGVRVIHNKPFLKMFDNPKPMVKVNFEIMFTLNKSSMLLYILLFDTLGKKKSQKRILNIDDLKGLLNSPETQLNRSFIEHLNKTVADINNESDINISYTKIKKRNIMTGGVEIVELKFIIKKVDVKESEETVEEDTSEDAFSKYVIEETEKQYLEQSSYQEIKNPAAYKGTIKRDLEGDPDVKSKFEINTELEYLKEQLKDKIEDVSQPHMIIIVNEEDPTNFQHHCYINEDYKIVSNYDDSFITKNASETNNFITTHNIGYQIQSCSFATKFNLSRI